MSRPVRFTVILFLAALGTTLAALGGWRYARASSPVSGPIMVISVDTLRADHLPAYGYAKVKTPAINALAGASRNAPATRLRTMSPAPISPQ